MPLLHGPAPVPLHGPLPAPGPLAHAPASRSRLPGSGARACLRLRLAPPLAILALVGLAWLAASPAEAQAPLCAQEPQAWVHYCITPSSTTTVVYQPQVTYQTTPVCPVSCIQVPQPGSVQVGLVPLTSVQHPTATAGAQVFPDRAVRDLCNVGEPACPLAGQTVAWAWATAMDQAGWAQAYAQAWADWAIGQAQAWGVAALGLVEWAKEEVRRLAAVHVATADIEGRLAVLAWEDLDATAASPLTG